MHSCTSCLCQTAGYGLPIKQLWNVCYLILTDWIFPESGVYEHSRYLLELVDGNMESLFYPYSSFYARTVSILDCCLCQVTKTDLKSRYSLSSFVCCFAINDRLLAFQNFETFKTLLSHRPRMESHFRA